MAEVGPDERKLTLAERKHEYQVGYYWSHREQARAATDAWKAANPERSRYLNNESAKRQYARKRTERVRLERARVRGRAWYAEHRDQERERHRRFRESHPDKVREYQLRYRERHLEYREKSRQHSRAWRDRNAPLSRALGREQAARRRAADPDIHKRYYSNHLEQQRARSREASRLRARLRHLGLPPRIFRRVYAEEKRAHTAAADEFFAGKRTAQEKQELSLERGEAPEARLHILAARSRAHRSPTTSQELEKLQAVNSVAREQAAWKAALPVLVRSYVRANRARIREEIRMDSIARQHSGKPPYEAAVELARRIRSECFIDIAAHLVPDQDPVRLGRLHATMFPSRVPATTQQALKAEQRRRQTEAQRLLAAAADHAPDRAWH